MNSDHIPTVQRALAHIADPNKIAFFDYALTPAISERDLRSFGPEYKTAWCQGLRDLVAERKPERMCMVTAVVVHAPDAATASIILADLRERAGSYIDNVEHRNQPAVLEVLNNTGNPVLFLTNMASATT